MEIPQFPVHVCWTPFSVDLQEMCHPWIGNALPSAEVPKVFLDDALDPWMTAPVQAAADDKEQIKKREEWRFLCLELVENDLNVTLDFCVETYAVKLISWVLWNMWWKVCEWQVPLYNCTTKTRSLRNPLKVCAGAAWRIHTCVMCLQHCHLSFNCFP